MNYVTLRKQIIICIKKTFLYFFQAFIKGLAYLVFRLPRCLKLIKNYSVPIIGTFCVNQQK